MKVIVRQIPIVSKPECTFYLKLEWTKDLGAGFVIVLSDGISAWSGEVSENDVTREAKEMEMAKKKYVHELQLSLTGDGQASQSYSFDLSSEQNSGRMQFYFEKVESDISFKLGMVDLLPVPEPTEVIKELISYGLERSADLQANNYKLLEENKTLRNEHECMATKMERYVQGKETLERDLYRRFLLVLNEKKVKIRALQEMINQLQGTLNEEQQRYRSIRKKDESGVADEKSEEERDYGDTTERSKDPDTQLLKPCSQEVFANPVDGSFNDITDVAPSRKRRQRHLQYLVCQTKRPALDLRWRNELPEEAKTEVRKAPFQQSAAITTDPDQLFDDI